MSPHRRRYPARQSRRVAHLTSVHRSDDPRIVLKECASLADRGYDVVLVARGRAPVTMPAGVRFVSAGESHGRLARMAWVPIRILVRAWRLRAQVYHIHDPELLPIGLLLRLSGAAVIYDAHEDLPRQIAYKPYIPPVLRAPISLAADLIERKVATYLDGIVAATPKIASRFPLDRTTIVQNFPRMAEFPAAEVRAYRERLPVVAYVGRLTEMVGAEVMVGAAEALGRSSVRFVLAGPIEKRLEMRLRRKSAHVEFPGRLSRSEVRDLLNSARVGVVLFQPLANYVEAYPTKLFEYMACGIPVVASDFPLWRDIVTSAGCGLLVDPTDPVAVAGAVGQLLDDEEVSAAMGQRGRHAVEKRFTWDEQAERLGSLYDGFFAGSPDRHLHSGDMRRPARRASSPPTDGAGG